MLLVAHKLVNGGHFMKNRKHNFHCEMLELWMQS